MNMTTDFARLPVENASVAVVAASALGPDNGRQIDGAVAVVDSSTEKGGPARSGRIVLANGRKSRGIPELDSPMAG